jgi:hypothetical protein
MLSNAEPLRLNAVASHSATIGKKARPIQRGTKVFKISFKIYRLRVPTEIG